MDLVKIAGFGCRLNYESFNVRFHLLKNDMAASPSSSLFDIIIIIFFVFIITVIAISKIIYHNQFNRCLSFIQPSTHDNALLAFPKITLEQKYKTASKFSKSSKGIKVQLRFFTPIFLQFWYTFSRFNSLQNCQNFRTVWIRDYNFFSVQSLQIRWRKIVL